MSQSHQVYNTHTYEELLMSGRRLHRSVGKKGVLRLQYISRYGLCCVVKGGGSQPLSRFELLYLDLIRV